MARFEIMQDGEMVVGVEGNDRQKALVEVKHYMMIYGQDGPVKLVEIIGRKRKDLNYAKLK